MKTGKSACHLVSMVWSWSEPMVKVLNTRTGWSCSHERIFFRKLQWGLEAFLENTIRILKVKTGLLIN